MKISMDSARRSKTSWIGRLAGTVALAMAFAIAATPAAALAKKKKASDDSGNASGVAAPDAACGATFSVCCTITSSGLFTMSANISTAITSGTCVSISGADNVTVNMAGFTINDTASANTATGIGISSSSGSINNIFIEGTNGNVTGFGTGISANPGTSSFDAGAYVDSVNVSKDGTGILAEGHNVAISSISAGSNLNGVEFDGCTNCSLGFGDIEDNTGYGVWVNNSDGTAVSGTFTASNTTAGIYVGCATTTPGTSCSNHGSTTKLFNAISDTNKYGIYIDTGEDTNNVAFTDGSSNTTDDAFANGDNTCAETNWFENTFTKVSPSCIGL